MNDVLNNQERTKLCNLVAQLTQLPSRLERLLKITREGARPSSILETHLQVIESVFQDKFVRNSVRDREVMRRIALDLEKSENSTERTLGQMFSRYIDS
jgi:hypothetical protein